jgi:secondary thiamine-phosphate synthase enzyme
MVETRGRGFYDVTRALAAAVAAEGVDLGLLTVWCRHTSASLVVQENADPDVQVDLEAAFRRLVPEGAGYRHSAEGTDDMPAHIRAALTATQLSVPVENGGLALGTWQAIYLVEHRDAPHQRELVLHLLGDG